MKNVIVFIVTLLLSTGLYGKKVICVDGCNSGFVNNHEAYERSQMAAGDTILVGGDLIDCLNELENGDELIIIAHGTGTGTGFVWGGMVYTGFGAGAGLHPVPADFGDLMNISVKFCSCWSSRDPDGAGGPNTSLADKLVATLGAGSAGTGFNDLATSSICYTISGGTAAQRQAGLDALKMNTAWMNNPPTNRPGPPVPNQQTAAQAIVGALPGGLTVTVTAYKEPENKVVPPTEGANGCACTTLPGCGFGTQEGTITSSSVPTLSEWGLIILALLGLSIGTVYIRRRESAFAVAGAGQIKNKASIFDKQLYLKTLAIIMLIAAVGLSISTLWYGYVTATDFVGTLISSFIVTYIVHLWVLQKRA